MDLRAEILTELESFLSAQGLGPSTFGREALGDPNFVRELRNGRRIWPDTADKVRSFMRVYAGRATPAAARRIAPSPRSPSPCP